MGGQQPLTVERGINWETQRLARVTHLVARGWNHLKTHSCAWWMMLAVSWDLGWGLGFLTAWQLGSKNKAEVWGVFRTKPQKSQSITLFILHWPEQP